MNLRVSYKEKQFYNVLKQEDCAGPVRSHHQDPGTNLIKLFAILDTPSE
jgi:hypothetical protein